MTRPRMPCRATVLLLLGLIACEDPSTRTTPVQVDTLLSGQISVVNTTSAWTQETAWRLEEDLRLGSIDGGRPEQQFGEIYAVMTDANDRIYVLENLAQEIRVFGPDGAFLRTIGGKGDGPGELSGAAGLNIGPDGRLWVYDTSAGFHVFETDGTFVTRHRRLVRGVLYPWRGDFAPDGHLYDWGISYPGIEQGGIADRAIYHPYRISLDFQRLDTLPTFEFRRELSGRRQVPFAGVLSVYQDRDGAVWFAHQRQYVIGRRTLDGDTTLVFSLPAIPARVTDEERVETVQAQVDLPPDLKVAREDIPVFKPIIRRIFGDNEGHIYVIPEMEGVPAGSAIDAFTTDGLYLGRMETPDLIRLPLPAPHATEDHLYVIVTDEFDVPYVSRLRIVRPD